MKFTPHHYLLPRCDYERLRRDLPELLGHPVLLVEDRLHSLGPDSPVRLHFASAEELRAHHVALIERLSELRAIPC